VPTETGEARAFVGHSYNDEWIAKLTYLSEIFVHLSYLNRNEARMIIS
jgi:hypothetical protein